MRSSREEWRKRVERWKDSGLTAEQYASELGINPGTLKYWKYELGKSESRGERRSSVAVRSKRRGGALPLVELQPMVVSSAHSFELDLGGSRRLRIPPGFDAPTLARLLEVLEKAR